MLETSSFAGVLWMVAKVDAQRDLDDIFSIVDDSLTPLPQSMVILLFTYCPLLNRLELLTLVKPRSLRKPLS